MVAKTRLIGALNVYCLSYSVLQFIDSNDITGSK